MTALDLNGKVALVTGAARGIGLETARAMHRRGARVALVDLDRAEAEAAAATLGADRALGLAADVTDKAAIEAAVQATVDRFGGLDVLVANAGIANRPATLRTMDPDEFERVVEVNLLGVWRSVRAALPHVVPAQGHVVVVASIYAFTNGMGAGPYAVAKAGVEQLGRALRTELSTRGTSVTVAYFGFIDTEMVHEGFDRHAMGQRMKQAVPKPLLKRLPPAAAGEGIARATEGREPTLILPRRWRVLSTLRGITGPLGDGLILRDERVRSILRDLDA